MCDLTTKSIFLVRLVLPPLWRYSPTRTTASSFLRFLGHMQRRTTVGRTPLEEWPVRRRDLYLTIQTLTRNRHPYPGGIRTHNLSGRAAADPRFRPQGHWDRLCALLYNSWYKSLMTVRMDRNMLLVNSNIQYTCVLDGDLNVYLLVGEV